MDLVAMIYKPRFLKTGSDIQKLIRRDAQTNRQDGNRMSLFPESSLKMAVNDGVV
jgi:hypothetical protein